MYVSCHASANIGWFPLANAFSDECHRRGIIPGLENSHLDRPVFGVGSHDARSVRVSAIRFSSSSPCFNSSVTPPCSDRRRTPHLNTTPTSKNGQRAGSPTGNSRVVRENSRGLIGSAVFSLSSWRRAFSVGSYKMLMTRGPETFDVTRFVRCTKSSVSALIVCQIDRET